MAPGNVLTGEAFKEYPNLTNTQQPFAVANAFGECYRKFHLF
jgi:hypothetical protein